MAGKKPGRPPGSGVRWTDFDLVQLWAQVKFLCWRDHHGNVTRALRRVIMDGWFQYRSGPAKPAAEELAAVAALEEREPASYTREELLAVAKRLGVGHRGARAWISRTLTDRERGLPSGRLVMAVGARQPNDDEFGAMRGRFYEARERLDTDPGFRRDAEFWLLVRKETHRGGGDPAQGFARAIAKQQK